MAYSRSCLINEYFAEQLRDVTDRLATAGIRVAGGQRSR